MKLTSRAVKDLSLSSSESERIVWDDDIAGLGIRMRAGGSRNWIFQYKVGAKHRRMTLGAVTPESFVSVKDKDSKTIKLGIREQVNQLKAKVLLGEDPAAVKAVSRLRASETFEPVATRFLAQKRKALRRRTYVEVHRHLMLNAKPLHGLSIAGIQRRDIAELLASIRDGNSDSVANHVRASLSTLFTWAMREGLAEANPVIATNRTKAVARERVLSNDELREIWAALEDDAYGDIVRLLMLTGQRREEIGALRWSEIDANGSAIVLPAARIKNGRRVKEHVIPMSDPAAEILRNRPRIAGRDLVFGLGAGGFSGWSKAKEELDQRVLEARRQAFGKKAHPLPDWRLHDLRRSVATGMADIGIQPHIIEAVLNHISGHKAGVAGVYNRATYLPEKKAALVRWADHLQAIVVRRGDKVVPLRATA